ncbi:hypothetical protein FOA52_012410 [Chlamydomonas sp. UWO 241]|nr:hypothetical protein FOA52_012410 [Chlamydomonas sp. UWO 241]
MKRKEVVAYVHPGSFRPKQVQRDRCRSNHKRMQRHRCRLFSATPCRSLSAPQQQLYPAPPARGAQTSRAAA